MTDKELIRRALLGSREAQQECTEKGIVLPCPFCGSDSKAFADIDLFGVRCVDFTCIGHDMRAEYYFRDRAIEDWNTRPVPPIGRCKDCINATNPGNNIVFCDYFERDVMPDDFCSYFEPREE